MQFFYTIYSKSTTRLSALIYFQKLSATNLSINIVVFFRYLLKEINFFFHRIFLNINYFTPISDLTSLKAIYLMHV